MSADQRQSTGALAATMLVARREFRARFLTKSNIVSLTIMIVLLVAGVLAISIFTGDDEDQQAAADYSIGVESQLEALAEELEAGDQPGGEAAGPVVDVEVMSQQQAEEALAGELDAFLTGEASQPDMLVEETADPQLVGLVTSALESQILSETVTDLGGDPDQLAQALATAAPQVETLAEDSATDEDTGVQFGPAYLVAALTISLLLFALISTGSLIAMGVVEEKTSRVVELLLSTITPFQLLAGKIFGIGLVGLTQVVLLGAAAVVPTALTGLLEGFEIDVGFALVMLILWFLLGFALYALLFGGLSALVSRQEEIGSVTTPLMLVLFIPFYMSLFMVTNDPDSTTMRVLSQIPFFSPFMMPVRSAFDAVQTWEVLLAVVIAAATIPLLVWIAGRIYRRGVLHTGGRMKLTQALRNT